ncbi:multifunctional 2',3'-cyclic-nucleotide 2'-phosphodiesterase/3'-nucleotidase/5'-nucleotidase [Clostridium sp.]|uniref:multifunctional 2',3'-cyclic-nucleotide 2'-phosphodiesterase/3'-nucleotidase/5'-nucleotidase n=1 Tax=Clostridium sp. TaxID=1506 RepID=UPI002FCA1C3B
MIKNLKNKKTNRIIIALTIVFSMLLQLAPISAQAAEMKNGGGKSSKVNIQILATSDLHGRFLNYDYAANTKSDGGLNQVATIVKEARRENPNTLVVDNGDTIQGNYNHLFIGGENPMMKAMNTIGYDTYSFGNHEFNNGMDNLKNVVSQANKNLNVLCANLYKDGKRVFNPYTTRSYNGVEVAIIGVVTPNIVKWDSKNLEGYETKNPDKEVSKVIKEIKGRKQGGADVYVVTSHVGLNEEFGNGDSATDIAKMNPEVSAVIAGHKHDGIEEVVAGNAVITEPASNGKYVSKVNIEVEKNGDKAKVINKSSQLISTKGVKEDPEVNKEMEPFNKKALNDATTDIGNLTGGDLANKDEVKGIPQSIVSDQGVTDFVNEVQLYNGRKYLKAKGINPDNVYHVSAAALFSADANLKEGKISKADIANIYKFDNTLYTVKTTGKQLKKYMEDNSKFYNKYKDGDLTVSFDQNERMYKYDMLEGVSYEINIANDVGHRVQNLKFQKDGKEVKDNDVVYLTINNYRYNSGLDAGVMDKGQYEKIYDSSNDENGEIRDLILDYITNVKDGNIERHVDNNWKLVGNNWNKAHRDLAVKLINDGKINIPVSEDGRTPNVRSVTWDDVLKVQPETRSVNIPIVTFNDFHGSLQESGSDIGASKLSYEIKRVKKENPNTIVVSGGDMYQGSALSNLLKGEPVTEMLKQVGLNFSAVGNHEFDWGADLISKWSKDGNFEFLASNIYDKKTGKPVDWAKPYGIIEKEGKKIGFVGLATPETAYKTNPNGVKNIEFKDPKEAAKEWTDYLRNKEKVDAVIVLSHLGSTQDKDGKITGEVEDVAKVPGIDAIVSAHSHQRVEGKVNGVPVIQAYKNGRCLGHIDLNFDKEGKLTVNTEVDDLYKRVQDLPMDEEMKANLKVYEDKLAPIMNEKVTHLSVDLPHDRDKGITKLGATVAEAMKEITNSDFAIMNGGGVRAPLYKGDITVGDMYRILPFDNTIVTMDMKGSDIVKALDHGIEPKDMGWGQHAGAKVFYDKGAKEGSKVTSVRLKDGSKIDPNKYYKVATNDFMAAGGDGYDFKNAKNVKDTNLVLREAMKDKWAKDGITPVENLNELLVPGKDNGNEAGETVKDPNDNITDDTNKDTNKEQGTTETNDGKSKDSNDKDLPKTGMGLGENGLAVLGLMALISGVAIIRKKDKKVS